MAVAGFLLGCGGEEQPAPFSPQTVINFPDKNLEAAIRRALGKPSREVMAGELTGLINLNAALRGIVHLTGIEDCSSPGILRPLAWSEPRSRARPELAPLAQTLSLSEALRLIIYMAKD